MTEQKTPKKDDRREIETQAKPSGVRVKAGVKAGTWNDDWTVPQ